jgi:integrin alpha FG-GAP repeat containing protein 1
MDAERLTQACQLPQSAYFALQTPYSLFGLGRTNNYVEDFFVDLSFINQSIIRSIKA